MLDLLDLPELPSNELSNRRSSLQKKLIENDLTGVILHSRVEQYYYAGIAFDGLLWISYPKRSSKIDSDLSRDDMWELYIDESLRPVSQISIDETWSAVRFRPTEKVGK